MTKTVSGLEEIREIDPFEGVELTFDGTSPNAFASAQNNSSEPALEYVYFEVSPNDGLKEGDTVTVRIPNYDEEDIIKNYGVRFSQTEKTYTVEGVDAYLMTNDNLDPAALETMKQATEEYVEEYFNDDYRAKEIKASDVQYVGYYLLTNKSTNVWTGYNKVYVVYSATVSSKAKKKTFKPKTVYFPVEYDDIKKLADGTYEINTSYRRILGSTDLQFGYWQTVDGYTSLETMADELIHDDEENYDGIAYDGLTG